MKTLLMILLVVMPSFLYSQYIPDTIYSEVNGNYVKIFDENAMRVCGTVYEHIVIQEDSMNFIWHQEYVSGMPVYCICNYNYMVEIGPLDVGVYNMDVFYESSQYNYLGSTTFEIISPLRGDTVELVNSYSSDCYFVGIDKEKYSSPINVINNHPNKSVEFEVNLEGRYELEIITSQGKQVFKDEFEDVRETIWHYNDMRTGIYIYKLKGNTIQYTGKIMIVN